MFRGLEKLPWKEGQSWPWWSRLRNDRLLVSAGFERTGLSRLVSTCPWCPALSPTLTTYHLLEVFITAHAAPLPDVLDVSPAKLQKKFDYRIPLFRCAFCATPEPWRGCQLFGWLCRATSNSKRRCAGLIGCQWNLLQA